MLSQQILDSIVDRMLVLEADGTIALANLAWQQFAHRHDNLDVRAAGVGTNYLTLCRRAADLGNEIAQRTLDGVQAVLNGAQASFSFEYSYHTPGLASSINEAQASSSFAYLYHSNLKGHGSAAIYPGFAAHYRTQQWFLLCATTLIGSSGRVLVTYTDITDRKQAEQQMAESIEILSTAEAVTHIGSWAWDLRSNRITWSAELYRLFGVDRETCEENLDRVFEQAIHPDDRARVRAANVRVITTQEPAPIEYRIVRPNGEIRVVFGDDRIIFDPFGNMIGIRGNIHDRTESRHIEDELRLEDQRLNALFELSQHAYDMSEHDVIRFAVEQAALLTSSTIGYLHFINADQQAIQMFAWSQAAVDHSSMEYKTHYHTHYHVAWAEAWADCIHSGRPVVHNTYASLPICRQAMSRSPAICAYRRLIAIQRS
jgi:PAS domain S-box-containing protein